MSLSRIIIVGVIASIAIFAALVIQNQIVVVSGWTATFTGAEVVVAPAIVVAAVFIAVLEKLQTTRV